MNFKVAQRIKFLNRSKHTKRFKEQKKYKGDVRRHAVVEPIFQSAKRQFPLSKVNKR